MSCPPDLEFWEQISRPSDQRILLIVIDGLGGLGHPEFGGLTELEYASENGMIDNLNEFVDHPRTVTGLVYPVGRSIIPGSGAGHLGLFGYDPIKTPVKRGAIEAEGVAQEIPAWDIVARVNFARVDQHGSVVDRRAGRLNASRTRGAELAAQINENLNVVGVRATVVATRDHRGILTLKQSPGNQNPLHDEITDTDPGQDGRHLAECRAVNGSNAGAVRTAEIVQSISEQAHAALANEPDANSLLLRGFARHPQLKYFEQVYKMKALGIALYPLYRGVARLVGMSVVNGSASTLEDEVALLENHYEGHDFVYFHYKKPDVMAEDGNFLGKVEALAEIDKQLPNIIGDDRFSVVAITGDHSTPSVLGRHSEHSVPLAIRADTMKGFDETKKFTEKACVHGSLGRISGVELMPILLAKSGRLRKFGG